MAQRKFLRQVSGYTEETEPFPRLFVADFNYSENNNSATDQDKVTHHVLSTCTVTHHLYSLIFLRGYSI